MEIYMDFFTLILIALGLTADAFAVSITNGICSIKINKKHALHTAVTFGLFQALMPVIGFFLCKNFFTFIHRYQHWAALLLLAIIGINMLVDAVNDRKNPEQIVKEDVFTTKNLILQGIATSIDAMAAGVSFAALDIHIMSASLLIGIITFFFCFAGVYIGRIFGLLLGIRARFVGGAILLLIGVKIFLEAYL